MAAMSSIIPLYHFFVILIVAAHSIICCGATDNEKDVYIVYMGSLPEGEYSPTSNHLSVLQEVVGERYLFINFYLLSVVLINPRKVCILPIQNSLFTIIC
jgi:hypothetical protein